MKKKLRILGFILTLIIVAGIAAYGVRGLIKKDKITEINDYQAYSEEVINAAKAIPVQDSGRVKPFDSWASTFMLAMHGERGMKIMVDGKKVKISPTAWLLDVIFRPEQADKLPTFRVENSAILEEMGMKTTELRAKYSLNQLKPYLAAFDKENRLINEKIKKSGRDSLTMEEKQTEKLFERISIYFNLRNPFTINERDKELLKQLDLTKVSDVFGYKAKINKIISAPKEENHTAFQTIVGIDTVTSVYQTLARQPNYFGEFATHPMIPPADLENDTWMSPGKEYYKVAKHNSQAYQQYLAQRDELLKDIGQLSPKNAEQIFPQFLQIFSIFNDRNRIEYSKEVQESVKQFENLVEGIKSNKSDTQLTAIEAFKDHYAQLVAARGEGTKIVSEIKHNKLNYFNNSLVLIILSLLIVIARCMALGTALDKPLYWFTYGVASIATLYIIAGITHRSLIMGRPPVGNLYDTMPFIVAACLVILLLLELIGKEGILLAVATVLGIGGIILAKQYEVSQASDHLSPLRAVLKSNYWLTTHVITITIGYAGGLITAALSVFFILGRAFGIIDTKKIRKKLTGIVYGMVAFTLVFSLIGTILGGIWGADSWGRFWGWDPKENGALLIVIWVLIVLHARLGGYIKEMGLHCCGAFTAVIVVFSWWHVNFLGVGLHSYGFTSADAMGALWIFYGTIAAIIITGIIVSVIEKEGKRMRKQAADLAMQQHNGETPQQPSTKPSTKNPYED